MVTLGVHLGLLADLYRSCWSGCGLDVQLGQARPPGAGGKPARRPRTGKLDAMWLAG